MKVISGKYKGRNLKGYQLDGTRPTMDRIKESLFGMIQEYVIDSVVLDLFAGSGALGIEALSEGAKSCVFVDKSNMAIGTILDNIKSLSIKEDYKVIKKDYQEALKEFQNPFTLIFLDPPYDSDSIKIALIKIKEYKLLEKGGILVLESDSKERLQYDDTYYEKIKERQYGDKFILILKRK